MWCGYFKFKLGRVVQHSCDRRDAVARRFSHCVAELMMGFSSPLKGHSLWPYMQGDFTRLQANHWYYSQSGEHSIKQIIRYRSELMLTRIISQFRKFYYDKRNNKVGDFFDTW